MSHAPAYRAIMNSKRHTGYGIYYLSRQIAQRIQQEWEAVESPTRPAHWGEIIPFPRSGAPWPPPAEGRLAAARFGADNRPNASDAVSA